MAYLNKKKYVLEAGAEVDNPKSVVPPQYICPISCEIMTDPVICADGFTYDRASIVAWLRTHSTSPMTNVTLPNKSLISNMVMKEIITSYVAKNPEACMNY